MVHTLIGDDDVPVEVIATDLWNCRMLLADRYQSAAPEPADRGDAAHLNPPWGGHGFNTCVGDAVNVAWKLAAVLSGWAGPQLLGSYEPERRPVAARTIADAGANNKALAHHFASDLLGQDGAEADAAPGAPRATCRSRRANSIRSAWFSATTTPNRRSSPATARRRRRRTRSITRPPRARVPAAARLAGRRPFHLRPPRIRIHPGRPAGRRRRHRRHQAAAADHGIPLTVLALSTGRGRWPR